MDSTRFPGATALIPFIAALGACSGGSTSSTSTGSGGADGGPHKYPAQGAWHAELLSSGGACSITSQVGQLGSVTTSTKDKVIVDGSLEGNIACAVKGTSTFSVHAEASDQEVALIIDIPAIDAAATAAAPAKGTVSFSAPNTGSVYSSPAATPCDFYFTSPTGLSEGIASGKVWVSFVCPTIVSGQSTCELGESVAIFENCTE
jgi:hypothetical protein